MGTVFETVFAAVGRLRPVFSFLAAHGAYIGKIEENLDDLKNALEDLKAKRCDLLREVDAEELKGGIRSAKVERWLSKVETIETDTNLLVADATAIQQRLSTYGYCSCSFFSVYGSGKKISVKLNEVQSFLSAYEFEVVAAQAPPPVVVEESVQQTFGLDTTLQRIWSLLRESDIRILGLYGMGGVGKTTLLSLIDNKFANSKDDYDVVIWVEVSKDADIGMIQDDIGKRLALCGEDWIKKSQREKAGDIHRVLKHVKHRFVLLLDDLWEEVSLIAIGIPLQGREYKVVFTTRFKDVCGSMGANKDINVECLAEKDALDLLKHHSRRDTLNGEMLEHAKDIVKKCLYLPLAIVVIGKSLSCKTTADEWHQVLSTLESSLPVSDDMEKKVFPVLKYSYDHLEREDAKLCFLYCALFPEAHNIRKDELVEYWIGEGIIDEEDGREGAMSRGLEIIRTLVGAWLLLEDGGESKQTVYMHGLIREMALWIVTGVGERFLVKTGVKLSHLPNLKNWKVVTKMSLMNNEIESITDSRRLPNPDRLITLFLQNNRLVKIVGNFFLVMSNLVVLDLSSNPGIIELPEEFSMLVALRYLSLLKTGIKNLQVLKDLIELIHLDLESTSNLQSISIIAGLLKLQVLRFYGSRAALDLSLLKSLEGLNDLELLTITVREVDVLEAFLGSNLKGRTQGIYLEGLKVSVVSFAATFGALVGLSKLGITDCDITESETGWKYNGRNQDSPSTSSNPCITPRKTWFKNLSAVELLTCEGLTTLTWLIYAANLEYLSITLLPKLKEIISEEKAAGVSVVDLFQKLKVLHLEYLDELKSIYWSPLSFPCLKKVHITGCPKLRKLPLNSRSVKRIDDLLIEVDEGWVEEAEWESGAEERFRPVIRTTSVTKLHLV
ncbi:PREDICTED: probable disease resistance protein At5g47250 [Camelina sativa]|uniref:Probable disease resistance protein At5g47250 n=1 Tax=Camelina sativa TaxID=90675 RepID=A0ABM0T849_CAMSA|nr:PREDICTED: probable disease resistance protein At5g47250 [Camelina sativa]XP_010422303.1 PREDICTED: probable disease resistance protein At5g47250 [Camelina sativa]XP_019084454.1 PREDICTED: probable disease resistance protein At5g47250 [Camelina sativa]